MSGEEDQADLYQRILAAAEQGARATLRGASGGNEEASDELDEDAMSEQAEALAAGLEEDDFDDDWEDEDDDEDDEGDEDDDFMEVDEDEVDPEDDGDEDDEEDENGSQTIEFTIDPTDDGQTFLELAALLNSSTSSDGAQNILARLLGGRQGFTQARTRSGASMMRRALFGDEEEPAQPKRWWTPQTEPHPKGLELLRSGEFGTIGGGTLTNGSRRLRHGRLPGSTRRLSGGALPKSVATLPNTNGTIVATYPSVPYVGQYAKEDYSLFFSATQNFTLHLYDVAESRINKRPSQGRPRGLSLPGQSPVHRARRSTGRPDLEDDEEEDEEEDDDEYLPWGNWTSGRRGMAREETSMKSIKTVQGEEGQWTVTDADSTKSGDRMIYSSITPFVYMFRTDELDSEHTCLDFHKDRSARDRWGYDNFGIWSIRFSADGKEVVAGCGGGKIMVYDIDAERRTLSINGHSDDTNAVCFADESSTNILVSGADDGYVKVWDRRSLSSSVPSGTLVGATEGITYTSPKGDGRYIVVNSKDQAARLYDLRKMKSWSEFESEPDAVVRYGAPRYDYRSSRYPTPKRLAHPSDCSVMTFRGHSVLRTLIRCHFSPRESTGQSYIYSGSADGMIHIWSLDGRVVQVLDRSKALPLRNPQTGEYNDPSAPEPLVHSSTPRSNYNLYHRGDANVVRDVSWHGFEPTLMSTSWSMHGGYRGGGAIAKHEWKGLGKGGLRRLEDHVEQERENAVEGGMYA